MIVYTNSSVGVSIFFWLTSNDIGLLHETKRFLAKKFEMKDLGDASFVLGIQIHLDRSWGILRLSQKSYIEKVLKRFGI